LASGTLAGQGFSEEESGKAFPREGMETFCLLDNKYHMRLSGKAFPREGMETTEELAQAPHYTRIVWKVFSPRGDTIQKKQKILWQPRSSHDFIIKIDEVNVV
jgi:hypothetical protein